MVDYGQLILGPPGSGKTTYAEGMCQLLEALGRPHLLINLDFGNDWRGKRQWGVERGWKDYVEFRPPDVDVRDLITVEAVMRDKRLGPNGSLLYCMSFLAANLKWLDDRIVEAKRGREMRVAGEEDVEPRKGRGRGGRGGGEIFAYLLFDMPGQVELYTYDESFKKLVAHLMRRNNLSAVHLVDAMLCQQPHQYLSALLMSLSAQISIELPFINVLSKIDLAFPDEQDDDSKDGDAEAPREIQGRKAAQDNQKTGDSGEKSKIMANSLAHGRKTSNFSLEYFARAEDLDFLIAEAHPQMTLSESRTRFAERERRLADFHAGIVEILESFSCTSFIPLDVQNKESVLNLLSLIDQSNGYALSAHLPLAHPGPDGDRPGEQRTRPDPMANPYFGSSLTFGR